MDFDMDKLEQKLSNISTNNLSQEEIEFMKYIYNFIIDSEDYNIAIKYLANIYEVNEFTIKKIRDIYFKKYSSIEEKNIYTEKVNAVKKAQRKEGFIDVSAMISVTMIISVTGLILAIYLYNLL